MSVHVLLDETLIPGTAVLLGGYVEPPPESAPADAVSAAVVDVCQGAASVGLSMQDTGASAVTCGCSAADACSAASALSGAAADAWQDDRPASSSASDAWRARPGAVGSAGTSWRSYAAARAGYGAGWRSAAPGRCGILDAWAPCLPQQLPLRDGFSAAWAAVGAVLARASACRSAARGVSERWQPTQAPPPGVWTAPPIVPPEPVPHPVDILLSGRLVSTVHILLGGEDTLPDGTRIIPVRRTYVVLNTASLVRVSNNLSLPVRSMQVSIDADSMHWTWSASLPLSALADLEPDAPGSPVELRATANGVGWLLRLERVRESERFGSASLDIGGRGVSAEIGSPAWPVVSHVNAAMRNAQQLAGDALTSNGVAIGWALDWQCADWVVPAGVWVFSGTPLDAVATIAAAAGAYVQPARDARMLRVLPRYPVAPWAWASVTPDVVLPADVVVSRGEERVSRSAYDHVYVTGQAGGKMVRVERSGAALVAPAPTVVDPLICHADPGRGRGLAILGNTGDIRLITLESPVLESSVIETGALLEFSRNGQGRRGLVRSLSVSANVGSGREPVIVRQTVEVETHVS